MLGLLVFAVLTMVDFQRLRRASDVDTAPLMATSIVLDILDALLFLVQISRVPASDLLSTSAALGTTNGARVSCERIRPSPETSLHVRRPELIGSSTNVPLSCMCPVTDTICPTRKPTGRP